MIVSIWTFIVMILSALICLVAPFTSCFFGKDREKKKALIFVWGILFFIAALILKTLLWSTLGMDSVIEHLLGKDVSVKTIAAVIKEVYAVAVETAVIYLGCRLFIKKDSNPVRALRFAGGYAFADSLVVTVMLVLSVAGVLLSLGGADYRFEIAKGVTVSADTIGKSELWQYLFKMFVRVLNLCIYSVSAFLIYTARQFEAKWLYFVAGVTHLFLDLPYDMCSLETVWYWRSTVFTSIVMFLETALTVVIAIFTYRAYYRKRKSRRERKAERAAEAESIAEAEKETESIED